MKHEYRDKAIYNHSKYAKYTKWISTHTQSMLRIWGKFQPMLGTLT